MTHQRELASHTCQCGYKFRVLADEYGDHPCPKCGYHPANDEWDGWPPYDQWTILEQERSLIGWLDRRVFMTTHAGVIRGFVKTFERMWAEEFGTDTPIPQDVKDRVNAHLAKIKTEVTAHAVN